MLGGVVFRWRDQVGILAALAACLIFVFLYCLDATGWGQEPILLDRSPERILDYRINLNGAGWSEFAQLPGIGPVLAQRIVAFRERHGPFQNLESLQNVNGIGKQRIESIRPFVIITPPRPQATP